MSESNGVLKQLLHPVSLIALLIVFSVFLLIGASILGLDKGNVVLQMGERQFARGIITYLFAVTTIGTAVVLVVAALTGGQETAENFQRGKEVLSLLLGVFGTIVGFYFGSEVSTGAAPSDLDVTPLRFTEETFEPGTLFEAIAFVSGGDSPYEYFALLGETTIVEAEAVPPDGWILVTIELPADAEPGLQQVTIIVEDSDGARAEVQSGITVEAGAEPEADE